LAPIHEGVAGGDANVADVRLDVVHRLLVGPAADSDDAWHVVELGRFDGSLGLGDGLLRLTDLRAVRQSKANRFVGTRHRGYWQRRLDQFELRAGGHVEQDGQLLREVRDLAGHLLERLLALYQRGASFQVSRFGQRFDPTGCGESAGAEALRSQEPPEQLFDAAE